MADPKPTEHKSLLEALLAAQAEMPKFHKGAVNPQFKSKYADLGDIVDTVRPVLVKHGLIWTTQPSVLDGKPSLRYRLAHVSGGIDAIDGEMLLMLAKQDPQGQGSGLTYARRYALCAVLDLVADDDDDGNAGSTQQSRARAKQESDRSKANMTEKAKDMLVEARELATKNNVPQARFDHWVETTGYTEDGLQRLLDYLKSGEAS